MEINRFDEDNDGFAVYVDKRKKKKKEKKVLRSFILSSELKNVCLLHLVGKCRKGDRCSFNHVDLRDPFYNFAQSVYYNFTTISGIEINRGHIFKHIARTLKVENGLNLINCIFYTKGAICRNEREGRIIEFPMKFKDKKIIVRICHADVGRCTGHILCGLHLDFIVEETPSRFVVSNIVSVPNPDLAREQEMLGLTKDIDTGSLVDFPDLETSSVCSTHSNVSRFSKMSSVSAISNESGRSRNYKKILKRKASVRKDVVRGRDIGFSPESRFSGRSEEKTGDAIFGETSVSGDEIDKVIKPPLSGGGSVKKTGEKKKKKAKKSGSKGRLKYKTSMSFLNDDDYRLLADQIFRRKIDPDETDEERLKRLEKENICLFKRNVQLTDELQQLKLYGSYRLISGSYYNWLEMYRDIYQGGDYYSEPEEDDGDDNDGDDDDDGDDDEKGVSMGNPALNAMKAVIEERERMAGLGLGLDIFTASR